MNPADSLTLEVYGRRMQLVNAGGRWTAYYVESGKRRPVPELVIPAGLETHAAVRYVADLCHEWASPAFPEVRVLETARQR